MNLTEFMLGYRNGSEAGIQLTTARRVLEQLLHSSSQGRGIGALLSYLELAEATARPGEETCSVDAGMFASVMDNARAARDWLTNMEKALTALTSEVVRDRFSGGSVAEKITQVLEKNSAAGNIREHAFQVEIGRCQGEMLVNRDVLGDVVEELVVNALKYSPAASRVRVSAGFSSGFFEIQIENECEVPAAGKKIPVEHTGKALTRPFYKLDNQIDDRYAAYRYGIGIGLTIAEYKVRQMGGTLEISEKPAPDSSAPKRLLVRVVFPSITGAYEQAVQAS